MKINEYSKGMRFLTSDEGDYSPNAPDIFVQEKPDYRMPSIEQGFADGGYVETPKRGLVNEPGSYAGAADVRAFLKKAKKGSTIDVAKFLDEFAETQAERNQLNADIKRISKEFEDKKLNFKTGVIGRKLSLEGKTGQIIKALQNLPKGSAVDYAQLGKDLQLGDDSTSLIKKIIKNRKELQGKNFRAVTKQLTLVVFQLKEK